MSGYVGDLSEEQEKMLEELKQRVDEYVQQRLNEDGWVLTEDQKYLRFSSFYFLVPLFLTFCG